MTNQHYQETKINESIALCYNHLNKIQGLLIGLDYCEIGEEYFIHKDIENHSFKFNSLLKSTYLLILSFIESQNNFELLKLYKQDLEKVLEPNFNGYKPINDDELEETFYISDELDKMKEYLIPFQAFNNDFYKNAGLIFLENILSNTSVILKELKIQPNSETQVYLPVKFATKVTFPDSSFPSEPFYKTAKGYKPDILIPSLNSAIEYKYAKDETKLINTIEQILIDVKGYSNHPLYKIFYAVFYVTPGFCEKKRFQIIWDSYKFPNNWKPILVIGE